MVWSEPTGLELIVPGDRDTSVPPSVDDRDYIRITGDLPAELTPYINTAILYYNGKYDSSNNVSAQLKYYGIGVGAGVGAVGSSFQFYYIENYGDIPGNTRVLTVNSARVEVQSAARKVYVNLGTNDSNVNQELTAQAPLLDSIHNDFIYPPGTNYIIDGTSHRILGGYLNGWGPDNGREPIGLYKDVTGRCYLQGSIRTTSASNNAVLSIASSGPWSPARKQERPFSCAAERESDGAMVSVMGIVRGQANDIFIFGIPGAWFGTAVRVHLAPINWHTSARLF